MRGYSGCCIVKQNNNGSICVKGTFGTYGSNVLPPRLLLKLAIVFLFTPYDKAQIPRVFMHKSPKPKPSHNKPRFSP